MISVYNFNPYPRLTTRDPIEFTLQSNDIDLTDCVITIQFRKEQVDNPVVLTLSTENGGITVNDANRFTINEMIFELPAGKYIYDALFEYGNGSKHRYIQGEQIIEDVVTIVN